METSTTAPVIVVGAGVAGLTCAIALHRAGRGVVVLEAGDDVGGRVRSTRIDGATIDHGFQVLFTAYPTLRGFLDFTKLELRRFDPAARIVRGGKASLVGDALRDPGLLVDTVTSSALPFGDKLRMLALRRFATSLSSIVLHAPSSAACSQLNALCHLVLAAFMPPNWYVKGNASRGKIDACGTSSSRRGPIGPRSNPIFTSSATAFHVRPSGWRKTLCLFVYQEWRNVATAGWRWAADCKCRQAE